MPTHWTGLLHLGLALAALLTGLAVTLTRKGTGLHRRWGWAYVVSMLGLNLTALLIYRLLGHFGPFHVAAIFSLLTVLIGMVPVRRRANRWWLRQHAYWMSGSYIGLWAAAVAETTSRSGVIPFWWMVAASSLAVCVVGVRIALRQVPRAIEGMKRRS
jgi:uncharacterized membrane protein